MLYYSIFVIIVVIYIIAYVWTTKVENSTNTNKKA